MKLPPLLERLGLMTAIRDTELLEQSLLKTLGSTLGVTDVSLYKTDPQGRCRYVVHHHRQVLVDADGMERVTERQDTVYNHFEIAPEVSAMMSNVRLTGRCSQRRNEGMTQMLYPLTTAHALCGFIAFALPRLMLDSDHAVVEGILQVYANYYGLLDESQRDHLTGLHNRQALELSVERLWPLLTPGLLASSDAPDARRAPPQGYWMVMIDVDHFKGINDAFGHVLGDEILLLVSRLLQGSFRRGDPVYRYGGEEFLVITSAASESDIDLLLERIRRRIAEHSFPQVGRVTVSMGCARIDPRYSALEIIGRADRSLYQAKRDGRNRSYCHEALVRAGVLAQPRFGTAELF